MNPDAAALALATDRGRHLRRSQPGQSITVKWRGKPVFIRNRTAEGDRGGQGGPARRAHGPRRPERQPPADAPADDANRAATGKENWLIMIGICTHLGCVPLGQQGEYGGWFCPCHGSHYDTAGRIRKGPAPENLAIPPYAFTDRHHAPDRLRPESDAWPGTSTYQPKSRFARWLESRLPIIGLVHDIVRRLSDAAQPELLVDLRRAS